MKVPKLYEKWFSVMYGEERTEELINYAINKVKVKIPPGRVK